MRYAFFLIKRRLLVEEDGVTTMYDSEDHRIGGVSQLGQRWQPARRHSPVSMEPLRWRGAGGGVKVEIRRMVGNWLQPFVTPPSLLGLGSALWG